MAADGCGGEAAAIERPFSAGCGVASGRCDRKARHARSQRIPASLRIGHAIPGVDALLFGHGRPFSPDRVSLQAGECAGGRMRILVGVAVRPLRSKGFSRRGMVSLQAVAIERPAMPDRKGFPHPSGSATPSLAWTLCSSGMAGLSRRDKVSLQAGECADWRMRILVGVAVRPLRSKGLSRRDRVLLQLFLAGMWCRFSSFWLENGFASGGGWGTSGVAAKAVRKASQTACRAFRWLAFFAR
ncbi:hypothetical protein S7A_06515 [Pantoea sp. Sc1]|nr:hypothetical protein S7A_06515 [Pantoea sp. Sc1]